MSDLELLDENDNVINNKSKKRALTIVRNESVSFSNIKQTIFEYNSDQIYELLLQHGFSKLICEIFLSNFLKIITNFFCFSFIIIFIIIQDKNVNGSVLLDWSKLLDQNELEKELNNQSFKLATRAH